MISFKKKRRGPCILSYWTEIEFRFGAF